MAASTEHLLYLSLSLLGGLLHSAGQKRGYSAYVRKYWSDSLYAETGLLTDDHNSSAPIHEIPPYLSLLDIFRIMLTISLSAPVSDNNRSKKLQSTPH